MRNIAIRVFHIHDNKKPKLGLYIQINQYEIPENEIDTELAHYLEKHDFFESIIFAGREAHLKHIQNQYLNPEMASASLKGRLEKKTADLAKNIRFLSYGVDGKHNLYNWSWSQLNESTELIRQDCLSYLFKKSEAFKSAPEGLHYVAPSKHHNNVFLRASSVLEHPGNLSILLFWMLPFIHQKELTHIYLDTSGILPLGIALAYEALSESSTKKLPVVSSFKSYQGINSLKIHNAEKALILISASISGGLGRQVLEIVSNSDKSILEKNIVNLYIHNDRYPDINALCVINKHPQHEQVFGILKSYNENQCKFCKQGLIKVDLHGDLFTIEPPKINPIILLSAHLPDKVRKTLGKFYCTGFFKTYKHVNGRSSELEIFLDVSALFEYKDSLKNEDVESFKKQWKKEHLRAFTTNLKRIIYTPSPYSEDLAKYALDEYQQLNPNNTPEIIAHHNIDTSNSEENASSLIVSACLDNAHEIAGINHDLRKLQPNGNVAYLTCFFRGQTDKHRDRVKSSLTYNNNRSNDYDLYSVFNIDLPNCVAKNSWLKELESLIKLEQWINTQEVELNIPQVISERIEYLKNVPSIGMSEKLFWPSSQGVDLKIQDGFVFVEKHLLRDLSQSDVFVTMSTALHSLRNNENVNEKLFSKPYHRAVLDPDNFNRYNDGIVQAAILRAVRKDELNFTSSRLHSTEMTEIICKKISNWQESKSEALMEFLIAILTKSLILNTDDVENICNNVNKINSIPSEYKMIASYLQYTNKGNI
jgi:hypothetical protein